MGHVPIGASQRAASGKGRGKIFNEVISHHRGKAEIGAEGDFWHHWQQARREFTVEDEGVIQIRWGFNGRV